MPRHASRTQRLGASLGLIVPPGEDYAASTARSWPRVVRWYPWLITFYCVAIAMKLYALTEGHLSRIRP